MSARSAGIKGHGIDQDHHAMAASERLIHALSLLVVSNGPCRLLKLLCGGDCKNIATLVLGMSRMTFYQGELALVLLE